jgi:outer membrane protein OmpU
MKKVLLTTTALVMTAGVAAAEVSMSGKIQTAMSSTNNADMSMNSHIDLNVVASATTTNGVTVSTTVGYDAGIEADYNDDFTVDADENTLDGTGWATAAPEVAITYEGFTITAQRDGVDNLYDGDVAAIAGDLGVSGSVGGVSFAFVTDMDTNGVNGTDDGGFGNGDDTRGATSYSASYSAGDMTVSYVATSDDNGQHAAANAAASKISLSYKMGDVTLSAASDNEGGADSTNSFGISYAMGDIKVGYTAAGDQGANVGDDYDLSLSYAAGPLSASFSTNENSRTRLVAEYDLGGATAFFSSQSGGAATDVDFQAIGVNFSF